MNQTNSGDSPYSSENTEEQQVGDLLTANSSQKVSTYWTSDCVDDGSTLAPTRCKCRKNSELVFTDVCA